MNIVFEDFQTRAGEVEGYFDLVIKLAEGQVMVTQAPHSTEALIVTSEDLLKTLKAGCYLLLYNLTESTMRNAIEAIFDELRIQGTSFDDCRAELREEILKNFKKRNTDKMLEKLLSIARDVIHETFEASETFAGNLDARSIRRTADRFGFAKPIGSQFNLLQSVKDLRNDLAHGRKSFAEVGRNATPGDLQEAKNQTIDILTQTLTSIEAYLAGRLYLATP